MKIKPWLIVLLLTATSSLLFACGGSTETPPPASSPQSGFYRNNSITVGTLQRTYDYYIPPGLGTQPVPLILLFHGHGGNADGMSGQNGSPAPFKVWMDIADTEKFIVVYPNGALGPDGKSGWNDCRADATSNPASDDILLVTQLVQIFGSTFKIDSNRIYASGYSNGGHMAIRLALELSSKIAAIGVIAAGMPANSKCGAAIQPTSILFMNGTDDPISPYSGGQIGAPSSGRGTVQSTADSISNWVVFNQASPTAAVTDIPDLDMGDNATVQRYRYLNGAEQTEVELYKVTGGGHNEPSIQEQYSATYELIVGKQDHDIEMAHEVWAFLKDKRI